MTRQTLCVIGVPTITMFASRGKPVLVMRDTTERPDAVASGTVKLVGTKSEAIFSEADALLTDAAAWTAMSHAHNPYGDGTAARRIADHLAGLPA